MLINKQLSDGDVLSLKLVSGEELIAKLVSTGTDSINVQKPLVVNLAMDERTKQVGIQMTPYFILCADPDATLTIRESHILVKTLANDAAKSGYIEMTTGLKISSSLNNRML